MTLSNLLIVQLFAHILSDFYLQTEKWATAKEEKHFASPYLYFHAAITFLVAWALSLSLEFAPFAAGLAIVHLGIDGAKAKLKGVISKADLFFLDQLLHIIVIIATVYLFDKYTKSHWSMLNSFNANTLLAILGFAIVARPANFAIREILSASDIKFQDAETGDLPKAGRLIGSLERLLTLLLILADQFASVGFIIASKSILRYKEANSSKTEYVLVGSLLSFGLAIAVGITIFTLKQ